MPSGKWKVIDGKWITQDPQNAGSTSSRVSDALRYGSLDRRILSKHKQQPRVSLSRTNSCENIEEPMVSPSLKRTSPVQLTAEKMVVEVAHKKLGSSKTDLNNNIRRPEGGIGRTSAASKVGYHLFIRMFP